MNENINEIPYVPKDTLKVKLSNGAQLPKYDHEDILYVKSNVNMEIPPKRIAIISTGLSIELITNIRIDIQLLQVGVLAEKRLYIINNPATIDQDYRGEIKVILYNFSENSVNILIGDIIGRLSFNMIKKIQLQLYDAQN